MTPSSNASIDSKDTRTSSHTRLGLVWTLTGIVTFALLCISALLSGKVAQASKELQSFDLDRGLVVSSSWSGTLRFTGSRQPTGGIDQFLMTLESVDLLGKLPGIEAMHEYRMQPREAVQGSGEAKSARLIIVPSGFLQAHHLGGDDANALLLRGCIVADDGWLAAQGWQAQEPVHWMPPADTRKQWAEFAERQRAKNLPVGDNGEFDSPVCSATLTLPKGIGLFENVAFISTEHPALQGRTSGALPQLWLTVAPDADPLATFRRVEHFLAHEAQPAQPAITLHVNTFADHSLQVVNGEQLSAWQQRLYWVTWLVGLALLLTLVFVRWGALRRELALRQALGQPPRVAWYRVTWPYVQAIMGGTVIGALLAGPLSMAVMAAPWAAVGWQSGRLVLVSVTAVLILGALLGWCMREAPMLVLNRGAR